MLLPCRLGRITCHDWYSERRRLLPLLLLLLLLLLPPLLLLLLLLLQVLRRHRRQPVLLRWRLLLLRKRRQQRQRDLLRVVLLRLLPRLLWMLYLLLLLYTLLTFQLLVAVWEQLKPPRVGLLPGLRPWLAGAIPSHGLAVGGTTSRAPRPARPKGYLIKVQGESLLRLGRRRHQRTTGNGPIARGSKVRSGVAARGTGLGRRGPNNRTLRDLTLKPSTLPREGRPSRVSSCHGLEGAQQSWHDDTQNNCKTQKNVMTLTRTPGTKKTCRVKRPRSALGAPGQADRTKSPYTALFLALKGCWALGASATSAHWPRAACRRNLGARPWRHLVPARSRARGLWRH